MKKLSILFLVLAINWLGFGYSEVAHFVKERNSYTISKKSSGLKLSLKTNDSQKTKQFSKRKRIKGGEPVSFTVERPVSASIYYIKNDEFFNSCISLNSYLHEANGKRGPPSVS